MGQSQEIYILNHYHSSFLGRGRVKRKNTTFYIYVIIYIIYISDIYMIYTIVLSSIFLILLKKNY